MKQKYIIYHNDNIVKKEDTDMFLELRQKLFLLLFALSTSSLSFTSAFLLPLTTSSIFSTTLTSIHSSKSTSIESSLPKSVSYIAKRGSKDFSSFKISSSVENSNEIDKDGSYPYDKNLVAGLALDGIDNSPRADDPPLRIGHGYDIHRLEPDLPLVIGGVKVEFEKGSAAHSDGDAIYHSVTDGILGAIGLPDIGQLFPDNDPKWKGADSEKFMVAAVELMKQRGYCIGNVDVTLILQKPKVKDIKPLMKANLVRILETKDTRVNVKARTHEKVDSVGESRAWEVHVVLTLMKKY